MTARELKPLATAGKPSERPGERSELAFIDPADLVIDEDYQRAIGNVGRRNIHRILSEFDLAKFAPVIVTKAEGGKFIVIDGQHRATAALMHPGVDAIPAMIVDATPAEAAEIFAAVNGNVTKLTAAQLYRARLKAGDPFMAEIDRACQAAGVIVVATRSPHGWERGETMAVHALAMCMKAYGYDTLVTALQCVTQTGEGNIGMLRAAIIKALCSVLYDHAHWRDAGGVLLDAMDNFDFADALTNAQTESKKSPNSPGTIEALRAQIIAYLTENLPVKEAA